MDAFDGQFAFAQFQLNKLGINGIVFEDNHTVDGL